MTPPVIEVVAPSRLHFGLASFGTTPAASSAAVGVYGGVGAMIAEPVVRLRVSPSTRFEVAGRHASRVERFVARYVESFGLRDRPCCRIEVETAPDEHAGLGLGTQLGMAIASGLAAFERRPETRTERLAQAVGRGARSAVGAHGFRHGGLLLDAGKRRGESLGRLAGRVPLPDAWRFVLARPPASAGLAGVAEAAAFARLPPPTPEVTANLWRLAERELMPAAESADFDRFSAALHDYNVAAGECFADVQGGPFASEAIAELISTLRDLGCVGCGQSSWGPTVFALARSAEAAETLRAAIAAGHGDELRTAIVAPNNHGATIRTLADKSAG